LRGRLAGPPGAGSTAYEVSERILSETRDPYEITDRFAEEFARRPDYYVERATEGANEADGRF